MQSAELVSQSWNLNGLRSLKTRRFLPAGPGILHGGERGVTVVSWSCIYTHFTLVRVVCLQSPRFSLATARHVAV